MNKKLIVQIAILVGIYALLKLGWLFSSGLFSSLDLQFQDSMMRLAYRLELSQRPSPDIVYVDIDDGSLSKIPYSPDNPQLYAELVSILGRAGVKVQLIDMILVTNERESPLAQAIKRAGNVYLPTAFTFSESNGEQELSLPAGTLYPKPALSLPFMPGKPAIALNSLHEHAKGVGHINCWPDLDGVYRRAPLFLESNNGLVPNIVLRMASDYLQVSPDQLRFHDNELIVPQALFPDGTKKDITIPFDLEGKSRINFIGPWPDTFAHYSITTIFDKGNSDAGIQELRDEFENTLAIISDVTTGGRDFGPVPFSSYSPLSELHAHFLNGIITNSFIREASPLAIWGLELFCLSGLLIASIQLRGHLLFIGTLGVIVGLACTAFFLLVSSQILFPIVFSCSFLFLGSVSILLLQLVTVRHEKEVMRIKLTPYFAPVVMDNILESPEILTNVTKKELTILFSDIVGFTDWSSAQDPQDIHETLNRYFREMSSIVFSYEGTIDKFMGDGMLAFFGDPTPQENHAMRAVQAALAMQQKVWQLKKEWAMTGGMKIRVRIGIHTGEVVVGNMGSPERMDYTVIGSNVNLAQRLESSCAPDRILISENVRSLLDDSIATSSNGFINIKGFNDPIEVHYIDQLQPHHTGASKV